MARILCLDTRQPGSVFKNVSKRHVRSRNDVNTNEITRLKCQDLPLSALSPGERRNLDEGGR